MEANTSEHQVVPHDLEDAQMNKEVAENWELWSKLIGSMALPRLSKIKETIPNVTSVILCTADGLNLCSIDVPEEQVGQLAALNSTLFAVASSETEIVSHGTASPNTTTVHMSTGPGHIVLASFVQEPLGQLLLAVSAEDIQLGVLVVHTREAVMQLREWLSDSTPTSL